MPALHILLILLFLFSPGILGLSWYRCPQSTFPHPSVDHVDSYCTTVEVPREPTSHQNGDYSVNIFLKRMVYTKDSNRRHKDQPGSTKKSVWFLGGRTPASTSSDLEQSMAKLVAREEGDIDAFTFDVRGAGRSGRVGCPLSQLETPGSDAGVLISDEELPQCLEEFEKHDEYYTADLAAQDVFEVIKALNIHSSLSKGELYLYGYSFSSLLVQRAMQIYVDKFQDDIPKVKGVILDSPFTTATHKKYDMKRWVLDDLDLNFDEIGFEFLSLCSKDDTCSKKFMDKKTYKKIEPATFLKDVFTDLYEHGHCPRVTNTFCDECFRKFMGWMLRDTELRQLIPAFLYRLRRCDEIQNGDASTVNRVVDQWRKAVGKAKPTEAPDMQSAMLNMYLTQNELRNTHPLNHTALEERFESTRFADSSTLTAARRSSMFPKYDHSPYFNKIPSIPKGVDILIMSGELDPIAPPKYAKSLHEAFEANKKDKQYNYLVKFPDVTNFVLKNSIKRNDGHACGVIILQSFIDDPSDLDLGCAHDFYIPPNFDGAESINSKFFGTNDVWEGIAFDADDSPTINLWTFVGVESATVVFFAAITGILAYWVFLLQLRVRKLRRQVDDADGNFLLSKHSNIVEDVL